ncbi:hypothetical protein L0244_08550 [bacterium]|nr:hypothetical protein [bacterium]
METIKFKVVYLWKQERHVVLEDFTSACAALDVVKALRQKGFHSWTETL